MMPTLSMAIKHTTTKLKKRLSLVTFGMIERRGYSNRIKKRSVLKALGNKHYSDMTLIRSYAIELQRITLKSFNTIICSIRRFTC